MAGYQPYPEYKDSGVEWLGDVPRHWDQKRLKFTVQLINEKVDAQVTDLDYMGLEHIESWSGHRIDDENANSDGVAARFLPDDVLFGKLRPYLAKVYLAEHEGLVSTEALVIRPVGYIDSAFLRYFMVSQDFIRTVDSSTYGSKMPRASWDFIGNLPMLLPNAKEQQTIARFLDHKTTQIDALIAKKQTLLEKLAEKRTALISHAVTKGLNPNAKMKDSGVEWLGKIPENWTVSKLSLIATSLQTGPFGSQLHAGDYIEGGIPLINPADIVDGQLEANPKNTVSEDVVVRLSRHVLELGDLVIARRGEMGRAGVVTDENVGWLCGTGSLRARLDQNKIIPRYLLQQFSLHGIADYLSLQSVGSTMDNLNTSILGRLPVLMPSIEEQRNILLALDKAEKAVTTQAGKVGTAIEKLQEYRSALISHAVTGKVDVRNIKISETSAGARAA